MKPFFDFESAAFAWNCIQNQFPKSLAAVLMPDHLHLMLPDGDLDGGLKQMRTIMGSISKRLGISKLWQSVAMPRVVADRLHLYRTIRYIALNPCRAKLCPDPLLWRFSFLRDILGASRNPVVNTSILAQALQIPETGLGVRFYDYVMKDSTVTAAPLPTPSEAKPSSICLFSVEDLVLAASAALHQPPIEVQNRGALRSLFLQLASFHNWHSPQILSKVCGIGPRAIWHHQKTLATFSDILALKAANICLGDRRLLHFPSEQTAFLRSLSQNQKF